MPAPMFRNQNQNTKFVVVISSLHFEYQILITDKSLVDNVGKLIVIPITSLYPENYYRIKVTASVLQCPTYVS
jgi:hypothetical protein